MEQQEINDALRSMDHNLDMRLTKVEEAIKDINTLAEKHEERMEQILELLNDISANIKVANALGKIAMWLIGLATPVFAIWFSRHGG